MMSQDVSAAGVVANLLTRTPSAMEEAMEEQLVSSAAPQLARTGSRRWGVHEASVSASGGTATETETTDEPTTASIPSMFRNPSYLDRLDHALDEQEAEPESEQQIQLRLLHENFVKFDFDGTGTVNNTEVQQITILLVHALRNEGVTVFQGDHMLKLAEDPQLLEGNAEWSEDRYQAWFQQAVASSQGIAQVIM